MPQLSSLQSTLLPSLEGIDLAGRMLEWQLKNDNQFPSLSDQIKIGEGKVNFTALKRFPHLMSLSVLAHGVSGLCDVDYPMLEVGPNGLPLLRQMGLVNRIPLPPELVEHFGRKLLAVVYFNSFANYCSFYYADMQSYCMMGLFPIIQRAWLSIDSDIYVWTYEDG